MKRLFHILIFLLLCSFISNGDSDKIRKPKKFNIIPPGTVWLRDSLFIDKMEISNTNYREFMFWLKHFKSPLYKLMLPDTLVWRKKLYFQEPYMECYFSHPAFNNYPVVGISYRQAIQYCKWRSDMVNEYIYLQKHKNAKWSRDSIYNPPEYVRYRLPTKEEWEYAAQAGLDYKKYPLGYIVLTDKHGKPVSNTADQEYHDVPHTQDSIGKAVNQYTGPKVKLQDFREPEPVNYGKPNRFGIYNMLGNVSEIITDSIYKGINYATYINGTSLDSTTIYTIKSVYTYYGPEAWLGFRCVCEILKP